MPELKHIPLGEIDEPPNPMRASMDDGAMGELVRSLRELGQLQPCGVVQSGERYRIMWGHRRFIAAGRADLPTLMCLVYQPGETQEAAAMLAENSVREDVNAAEEAVWFAQLREQLGLDEAGLMAATKKSADYIGDRFRLLRDGEPVFSALTKGDINFSVARELNKCEDLDMRAYFLRQAIIAGTGARVVRQWIVDWRVRLQPATANPVELAAPSPEPAPEAPRIECVFCGGHRDPWNLVSVMIHKAELDKMIAALSEAATVPE